MPDKPHVRLVIIKKKVIDNNVVIICIHASTLESINRFATT
jgi:hypothetical protein